MAYGIRIKNNSLEIQIDGTNLNYVYSGQGGSSSVSNGYANMVTVNFTNPTPYPPIVLIQPTGGTDRGCGVFDYIYSGGYYTGVRFFGGKFPGAVVDSCPFNYKIYMVNPPASGEAYGLRIKSASGQVVYDSGRSPFKILEVAGSVSVGTTYNHGSYSDPYYIFSPWLTGMIGFSPGPPQQGPVYRLMLGLSKQSSTSVKGAWIYMATIGLTNMSFQEYQATTFTLILCAP